MSFAESWRINTMTSLHKKVNIKSPLIFYEKGLIQSTKSVTKLKCIFWFIWNKVFKSGPSKICGRQPLENLKGYGLLKQTIFLETF